MLPRVNLADLTAQQLAEEMVRRVPAHTPEWRNMRPGDPGRALIDVFAYMGESLLYRANLTPRRMRLEFLNLLNLKQRAALPAKGIVQLKPKKAAGAKPVFAPPATRLNADQVFETRDAITVQPIEGQVYIKRALSTDEMGEMADVLDSLAQVYDIPNIAPYASERLFAADDTGIIPTADPFAASIDQTAWIALLALDATPAALATARAAFDAQPALLNLGVSPKITEIDAMDPAPDPLSGLKFSVTSPARTLSDGGLFYRDLDIDADQTVGLSQEGTLRLVLPDADQIIAPSNDILDEVEAGVGDRPPRLDDPDLAARLIGWIRVRGDDPSQSLPLAWMGVNAVSIDGAQTTQNTILGVANGQAAPQFSLPAQDVDAASVAISVFEQGRGFQSWTQVNDLAACDREGRCFELDVQAGIVRFGDGLTGKSLPKGTRVRLDRLRAGGGTAGNLAKGSLSTIEITGIECFQPLSLHGGVDGETLEAAEKRVGAHLAHRNRCVTEDDYKAIGAELGLPRVEVIPGFRPHQRKSGAVGVVSVMILPEKMVQRPSNPRADRRLLDRMHAHIAPRAPLGTELYVISPEYQPLALSTALTLREGFAREDVVKAVTARLYEYLWPLAGGGTDGQGWTLGGTISAREIEVEIARVAGVRTTQGVNLFRPSDQSFEQVLSAQANGSVLLPLDPWQLPELLDVVIAVGAEDAPTSVEYTGLYGSETGTTSGQSIAVPIVPEVC